VKRKEKRGARRTHKKVLLGRGLEQKEKKKKGGLVALAILTSKYPLALRKREKREEVSSNQ